MNFVDKIHNAIVVTIMHYDHHRDDSTITLDAYRSFQSTGTQMISDVRNLVELELRENFGRMFE